MERHVEIWVIDYNPKYGTRNTCAYYDGDATLSEITADLRANQLEIRSIDYRRKGSVDVFEITVL